MYEWGQFYAALREPQGPHWTTEVFTGDEGRLHTEVRQGLEGPAAGGLPQAMERERNPGKPLKDGLLAIFLLQGRGGFC